MIESCGDMKMYLQVLFLQTAHWSVNLFTMLLMITLTLLHSICSWMMVKMKLSSALQRYCINVSEDTSCMCNIIIVQETYMSIF